MKRLLILVLLIGCTPVEDTKEAEVHFCPKDNCSNVFSELIISSNESVKCAFYDLELNDLIDALSAGAQVIIDEKTHSENAYLYNSLDAKAYDARSLMHNKFCVIDEKIVLTGSFNPTQRGNTMNNNNVVVLYSENIAENYMDEFDELWEGKRDSKVRHKKVVLNDNLVENYFCPEDCSGLVDLLYEAEESIYFMAFSFTKDEWGDALIDAKRRGLDVKGVCEKTQNNRWHEFDRLKKNGIDVKWDSNKANMHHKVFIIDNKTVITGSMNPSKNGLERNDENVLILHNERIAEEFLEEFEMMFPKLY